MCAKACLHRLFIPLSSLPLTPSPPISVIILLIVTTKILNVNYCLFSPWFWKQGSLPSNGLFSPEQIRHVCRKQTLAIPPVEKCICPLMALSVMRHVSSLTWNQRRRRASPPILPVLTCSHLLILHLRPVSGRTHAHGQPCPPWPRCQWESDSSGMLLSSLLEHESDSPPRRMAAVTEPARENIENIDRYNRSAVWFSSQSTEVSVSAHDWRKNTAECLSLPWVQTRHSGDCWF